MRIVHFSQQTQAAPLGAGLHGVLVRLLISGIAVFLAVATVPGLEADSFGAGVAAVLEYAREPERPREEAARPRALSGVCDGRHHPPRGAHRP